MKWTYRLSWPADVEVALQSHGIDHRRRAETLTIPEWGTLYAALDPLLNRPPSA